jgi:adaptin ear-binding coat-associated protein 1/2
MTFVVVLRYSADDWNLRKPLQQCSLRIERRGDVLLIVFTFQKEGGKGSSLFALCKVDLVGTNNDMIHYVKPVADSSRYFAVRVMDEKSGREATLGLGFREREEAEDFTQCLVNFRNAIARERLDRGANMAAAKVQ